jgi:hypothetical protein
MLSFEIVNIFVSGIVTIMFRPHTYLDPGSGSFILQLVIASLVGVGFFFRSFWTKLIKKFRKSDSSTEEEENDHTDNR